MNIKTSQLALMAVIPTLFACFAAFGQGVDKKKSVKNAAFQIPADGKPEELVGGMQYEGPSAFAFDTRNRPYLLHTYKNKDGDPRPNLTGVLSTLRDGKWKQLSFKSAIQKVAGNFEFKVWAHGLGSITFDNEDGLYLISQTTKGCFLVYSPDLGKSFQAYKLPANTWCSAWVETSTGHNLKKGTPAIGISSKVSINKSKKGERLTYGSGAKLSIVVPEKKDGRLVLEPVEVSGKSISSGRHSGGYSFFATVGNLSHIAYTEYDPTVKGNPTWIATYDRTSRKIIARKHLFVAPPDRPDSHSTPVITVDSRGYIHLLSGSHGPPALYVRSLKPNTIEGGWTKAAPMYKSQTYMTLVCDRNDVLHSVYRRIPHLFYQSKPATASEWSKWKALVLPQKGYRGYTGFYQQFVIDRSGNLYVSFTFTKAKSKEPEIYPRALMASENNGATWQLARTSDFLRRQIKLPAKDE